MSNSADDLLRGPWIRSKLGFQVLTADEMRSICEIKPVGDVERQRMLADLIAAAPILRAACELVLPLIEEQITDADTAFFPDSDVVAAHNALLSALATARGEAQ